MDKRKAKTITVLGPDKAYLSHCTWKRASILLANGRADRVDAYTIMLKETKQDRKKKMYDIIEKAGRICYICGEKIPDGESATIDHVIPKSRDKYADVYDNMRCCCDRCNVDKANMKPIEYINFIIAHREEHKYLSDKRIEYLKKVLVQYEFAWDYDVVKKRGTIL